MADRAIEVIGFVAESLKLAFSDNATTPPLGGGSAHVRLIAGDAIPVAAWNGYGCKEPLLWVRLVRRYRTEQLPDEQGRTTSGCARPRAITVEAGVMRCAVIDPEPSWEHLEREAMTEWDDSHRIDAALCRAMQCAEKSNAVLSTHLSEGQPWGPEGGAIAWTQWAHAQLAG